MRLILHTAAYWLLHTLRAAAPKRSSWRTVEFTTLRLPPIKIAALQKTRHDVNRATVMNTNG
jgi:hypothetical protein